MEMTISPNDQDPPDYVVGELPEEALYDAIYEKFPWVEDDGFSGRPYPELHQLIQFVIDEAHKRGREDAKADMGEYIDHLEKEAIS